MSYGTTYKSTSQKQKGRGMALLEIRNYELPSINKNVLIVQVVWLFAEGTLGP